MAMQVILYPVILGAGVPGWLWGTSWLWLISEFFLSPSPLLTGLRETTGSESDGGDSSSTKSEGANGTVATAAIQPKKVKGVGFGDIFKDKPIKLRPRSIEVENDFLPVEKVCSTVSVLFPHNVLYPKVTLKGLVPKMSYASLGLSLSLWAALLLYEDSFKKGSCSSLLLVFLLISCLWNVSQGDFSHRPALLGFLWRKATHAWSQINTWPCYFSGSLSLLLECFSVALCWGMLTASALEKGVVHFFLKVFGANDFRLPQGSFLRAWMAEMALAASAWVFPIRELAVCPAPASGLVKGRQRAAADYSVATATHPEPSCLWLSVTSTVVHF